MKFNASEPLTIGAEIEWQLLSADTLDLTDGILKLMEFYPKSSVVKPEFAQNMVETASSPCHGVGEMHNELLELVAEVAAHCRELDMRICGAGTHAFARQLALVTPMPRYQRLHATTGHLARTLLTFATHVHLGMPSGDTAIKTKNALRRYLPLLIGISAASPFWRGYDTGYAAYRHRILAATRSFGMPPSFKDWEDCTHFYRTMKRAGVLKSVRDIHWDIRPHPDLGTIEVRVMDSQSTVRDAVALVAFLRALVFTLWTEPDAEHPPHPLPWWIEKENHYQASRLGLNAPYVVDESGRILPLSALWDEVIDRVYPAARTMGDAGYLDHLKRRVGDGVSHVRQHRRFEETGSVNAATVMLVDELEQELSARVAI